MDRPPPVPPGPPPGGPPPAGPARGGPPAADRRALQAAYRRHVPAMGVFVVRNARSGRFQLHAARNLPAAMNRLQVEVTPSTNPNPALQRDWATLGPGAFEIRVLDVLAPRPEAGWDPQDDLTALRALWHERLVAEGGVPY